VPGLQEAGVTNALTNSDREARDYAEYRARGKHPCDECGEKVPWDLYRKGGRLCSAHQRERDGEDFERAVGQARRRPRGRWAGYVLLPGLREAYRRSGLTWPEISIRCAEEGVDVPAGMLKHYAAGNSRARAERVAVMARALGVEVEELTKEER
jgi:hypothetical protein